MNYRMIMAAAAIALGGGTHLSAAPADVFSKLDGSFRGSGTSVMGANDKKIRVSCQLTNTYDKAAKKLKMSGKCASSQGARAVKGTISHVGNKVTGTYIALRSSLKITKTSGKIGRNSVSVFASFIDNNDGSAGKIRQTLQLTGSGFQSDFFVFDKKTKKYKSVGVISFKRK